MSRICEILARETRAALRAEFSPAVLVTEGGVRVEGAARTMPLDPMFVAGGDLQRMPSTFVGIVGDFKGVVPFPRDFVTLETNGRTEELRVATMNLEQDGVTVTLTLTARDQ